MDKRTLTRLLSYIADAYEIDKEMHSKMRPEFREKQLRANYPELTDAQIKHILRII